jgi:hypothetical protein
MIGGLDLGARICPMWVATFASCNPDQPLSSFSLFFSEPLLHADHKKSYLEGLIEAEGWKIASYNEPRPFITKFVLIIGPPRRCRPVSKQEASLAAF